MAAQNQERTNVDSEPDVLEMAQEAVRIGILSQDVLDCLTSLNPQVPNFMKVRYLTKHLHDLVKNDEELTLRVFQVFLAFHSHKLAGDAMSTRAQDFPLSIEHFPDLAEFLVPYAFQWNSIGIAMRFKPQDLSYIQSCFGLGPEFPKKCLLLLLENWIQQKHTYTVAPTVNALEKVLYSELVGLGARVHEVRTRLVPNKHSAVQNQVLPYFVASLRVKKSRTGIIVTPNYSTDISQRIMVNEKDAVILETQVLSENVTLNQVECEWLMNGKPISEQEKKIHKGTKTSILSITSADIDIDGFIYSCRIIIGGCTFVTKPVTLKVICPLDKHTFDLASMYLAQPEIPMDTWPPVSCGRHVNLALIKQGEVSYGAEYAHCTIRGDIDDILQHKEMISYDEVVHSLKTRQVLFIEGRPGCGKTTFVHKITRDWATSSNGGIRLILLVSLRLLNHFNKPNLDLSDILDLFKDLKISKELFEERNGKGVCFIFDGLDEFSPQDKENSLVYQIVNKTYLNESTVVVASRPAAVAEIRSRANKVIEVLGFPNAQIREYFDNYPFSARSKSAALKAYLPNHPNILHMCYLPIHAAMVAFLFEKTGKVPETETEIYTHFTRFTLKRSFSKYGRHSVDVHNLRGEEENLFNQICKLALDKTILNKQVLNQNEIRSDLQLDKGKDTSLGLITVDRTADLYGYKDIYTFLHLTFQEYLAAHHISTLNHEEQHKLIREFGSEKHMLVVWKFYCGLVEFTAQDGKLNKLLQKTTGLQLFHAQCAYESQQSLPCTLVLSFSDHCLALRDKNLTIPDFKALGYVLEQSLHPVKLQLANCNIKYNIEAMNNLLSQCGSNLSEFDLSGNNLHDDGAKSLTKGLMHCHNIKKVSLRRNNLSRGGALAIFSSIGYHNVLEVDSEDILAGNGIGMDEFLNHIVPKFTDLQVLEILVHGGSLTGVLGNITSLKELHITFERIHITFGEEDSKYIWDLNTPMPHKHDLDRVLCDNLSGKARARAIGFTKTLSQLCANNLQQLTLSFVARAVHVRWWDSAGSLYASHTVAY